MIIDFHTHIFPDAIAERTIHKLETAANIHAHADGTLQGLQTSMKQAGVDYSVILPVVTKPSQFDSVNRFAASINGRNGILSLGGIGVISVLSHVAPKATHDICQLYFDGKVKESARLQLEYMDLIHALFIDVNPIPVKDAMNQMGFAAGPCRMPLYPMSDGDRAVLTAALKNHGLLK